MLLQMAEEMFGSNTLSTFRFRGVSPAIAGEPLYLSLRRETDEIEFGAFAADGRQVTKASATLA